MTRELEYASKILDEEMPTLEAAWGCENCKSIRRVADNLKCIVCGSSSIFDVAAKLTNRAPRTDEERVRLLIAEHLSMPVEDVGVDMDLVDDIGVDSVDLVEIVMGVEEEFGIEIDDRTAERVRTVRDLVVIVEAVKGI